MLTGEARRVLRVGDVVERDIDGIWFPAEVSAANSSRHYVSGILVGCDYPAVDV